MLVVVGAVSVTVPLRAVSDSAVDVVIVGVLKVLVVELAALATAISEVDVSNQGQGYKSNMVWLMETA